MVITHDTEPASQTGVTTWTLYTLIRLAPREQKANSRHWRWLQMKSQEDPRKSNQGSKEQPGSGWRTQLKSILCWLQQYINSSFPFEPGTWRIDGIWEKKGTLTNSKKGHIQAWCRKLPVVWYEIRKAAPDHWAFFARCLFRSACWKVAFSHDLEWCMYLQLLWWWQSSAFMWVLMHQTQMELPNNIFFI